MTQNTRNADQIETITDPVERGKAAIAYIEQARNAARRGYAIRNQAIREIHAQTGSTRWTIALALGVDHSVVVDALRKKAKR